MEKPTQWRPDHGQTAHQSGESVRFHGASSVRGEPEPVSLWGRAKRPRMMKGVKTMMVRLVVVTAALALIFGCRSGSSGRPMGTAPPERTILTGDGSCRLGPARGDTRMTRTDDGRIVMIGVGLGVMVSEDGGRVFRGVRGPRGPRWPAVTSDGTRVWVSWIRGRRERELVVASVGRVVGPPVGVTASPRALIDSELLALGQGRLLAFVTEVEGIPNSNQAVYTVRCLASEDGGVHWHPQSTVVSGPFGINIEDLRAVETDDGAVLLAFEWETAEGGPSEILMVRSDDDGASWSTATVLWGGDAEPVDREPGGFVEVGRDLWMIASTDRDRPGTSYGGATIAMIRSSDGGRTWTEPRTVVRDAGQLAMGGIFVDGVVMIPSLRNYADAERRFLALYRVDAIGRWPLRCGPS